MIKQQLFKSFNRKSNVLFSVTALMDSEGKDGKVYNKIQIELVQLNQSNKAEKQTSFFMDLASSKVLMHDLWTGDIQEFKDAGVSNVQRYLTVSKLDTGAIGFKIDNKQNGDYQSLAIGIGPTEARKLARTTLDFLRNYEMARALASVLKQDDADKDTDRINSALQMEAEVQESDSDVRLRP